jgi:dipicolinate synthase subunit A
MDFPGYALGRYRVIFNTVPAPVLSSQLQAFCRPECLKIDLASQQGIQGEDVVIARGLPGKEAPESSGRLIAEMVLKLCAEKES